MVGQESYGQVKGEILCVHKFKTPSQVHLDISYSEKVSITPERGISTDKQVRENENNEIIHTAAAVRKKNDEINPLRK